MKSHFAFGTAVALCMFPVALLGQIKSGHNEQTPARAASFAHLPLSFEANQGQTNPRVNFLSRGQGYILFLSGDAAVLKLGKPSSSKLRPVKAEIAKRTTTLDKAKTLHGETAPVLQIKLLGTQGAAKMSGVSELPGKSNYFIGKDPKKLAHECRDVCQGQVR